MSDQMRKDLKELMDKIIVPSPVYRLFKNDKNLAMFKLESQLEFSKDFGDNTLARCVRDQAAMITIYNGKDNNFSLGLSEIQYDEICTVLIDDILHFIRQNINSANPRLTKLYRFYNNLVIRDIDNDIYTLWKYIQTYNRSDDRHIKNIMAILQLLMERRSK